MAATVRSKDGTEVHLCVPVDGDAAEPHAAEPHAAEPAHPRAGSPVPQPPARAPQPGSPGASPTAHDARGTTREASV